MTNLITSGFSRSILSADCSAKLATKPMNMVSREFKKVNPNISLIERAGKYGAAEMKDVDKALVKAREELDKAKIEATKATEIENEKKAEEKTKENVEAKDKMIDKSTEGASDNAKLDKVEISADALLNNNSVANIAINIPIMYSENSTVQIVDFEPTSQVDVRV